MDCLSQNGIQDRLAQNGFRFGKRPANRYTHLSRLGSAAQHDRRVAIDWEFHSGMRRVRLILEGLGSGTETGRDFSASYMISDCVGYSGYMFLPACFCLPPCPVFVARLFGIDRLRLI